MYFSSNRKLSQAHTNMSMAKNLLKEKKIHYICSIKVKRNKQYIHTCRDNESYSNCFACYINYMHEIFNVSLHWENHMMGNESSAAIQSIFLFFLQLSLKCHNCNCVMEILSTKNDIFTQAQP